jgi:prepilin-type N-terminal cleavage/methylation domain-containing protein
MNSTPFGPRRPASAFTLIELLTVIAIIAVLASLLLTSLHSASKKSRTTVCTFNLHQISLAVNMYMDDEGKHPPVDVLAASKYLPTHASLLCPEDKTGNWGGLVAGVPLSPAPEDVNYSYLMHPLNWDEDTWKRLMRAGSSAGIAACQLHGLGHQNPPDLRNYSGLLLRGQRDGAVVRRQYFWPALQNQPGDAPITTGPSGLFNGATTASTYDLSALLPIYLDDTNAWPQTNP